VEFLERLEFDAPPQDVWAMMLEEDYLRRCSVDLGATRVGVAVTELTSSVTMRIPTPWALRPLVGLEIEVYQQYAWSEPRPDGSRRGAMRISARRSPIVLAGSFHLLPTPQGTVIDYVLDLTAMLPMHETRIAPAIEPTFRHGFTVYEHNGHDYLARSVRKP